MSRVDRTLHALIDEAWRQHYRDPAQLLPLGQQIVQVAGADPAGAAWGWLHQAWGQRFRSDGAAAQLALDQAKALFIGAASAAGLASCRDLQAMLLGLARQWEEALALLAQNDAVAAQRSAFERCQTHQRRGWVCDALGRRDDALRERYALLAAARETGDEAATAHALGLLGGLHADLYNLEEAEAQCAEAALLAERSGALQAWAIATLNRMNALLGLGRGLETLPLAQALMAQEQRLNQRAREQRCIVYADAHTASAHHATAQALLDESRALRHQGSESLLSWTTAQVVAWLAQGEPAQARDLALSWLDNPAHGTDPGSVPSEQLRLLQALSSACEALGDTAAALRWARQAFAMHETLVGRSQLLQTLQQAVAQHRLTLLQGEAGLGKSRLLQALQTKRPGVHIHEVRVSDRRVAFASLVRWLRGLHLSPQLQPWVQAELARLLPEWGTPPAPITTDAQRLRFFEAVHLAWTDATAQVTLHVFDDWQFVDEASALWWSWWMGRAPAVPRLGLPAPVLVAERPGQAAAETANVLNEARMAEGGQALTLQALTEADTLELVRALSGTAQPRRFAQRLWQATGGHPFYVLETLQHLLHINLIQVDDQGQWNTPFDSATSNYSELPIAPSVHAAVMQRVQSLDEAARRLLEAASLTGDDFSLPVAAAASALGEWDAVQAMESALHARVLIRHETQPGVYRFVHDLFAQAVATALSPERRRLMHRAIGQRLAQDGAAPARVAEHFGAGGDAVEALHWRLHAMTAASQRLALGDMLVQAEAVLGLAPNGRAAVQAQLCRASALLARARGPEAQAALDAAAIALRGVGAEEPGVDLHVDLVCLRGTVVQQGQGAEQALAESQALLQHPQLAAQLSPHQRGRLHKQRAGLLSSLSHVPQAEAEIERALAAFGDEASVELGDLLDSRSRNAMNVGNFTAVLSHARQAVQVMLDAGRPALAAAPQTMCGVALMCQGLFEEALAELLPARQLAHQHGLVSAERGAILNLVPTLLALGRADEALACLEEGYTLSPHFRGASEQQAFLEARYQCRAVVGDLGGALDLRPELLNRSRALGDHHRRLSGLLVSLDLPLLLGHPELIGTEADEALAMVAGGPTEYLGIQTLAKCSALALARGDTALALQRSSAAVTMPNPRPEDVALCSAAHASALLACGQPAAARGALVEPDLSAGSETVALLLAAGLRVQAASGGADPAWLAHAEALLQSQQVPLPHRLDLLAALAMAAPAKAAPWHQQAAPLARRLHASLAAHTEAQASFARRHGHWLPAAATGSPHSTPRPGGSRPPRPKRGP